jgi:hypothetical protein
LEWRSEKSHHSVADHFVQRPVQGEYGLGGKMVKTVQLFDDNCRFGFSERAEKPRTSTKTTVSRTNAPPGAQIRIKRCRGSGFCAKASIV